MGRKLLKSGGVLKKCGMRVDIISQLPDHVIVNILSFLKLEQAASTSLISHQWLHLWKYTPKLNFIPNYSNTSEGNLRYVNWINSVLKMHKGSLQEFTINFCATKSNRYDVAKWLEFAFSRQVERLEFNWNGIYMFGAALPLEDILENITIPSIGGIQSLKVLCLIDIKTSGDAIQFFLRNCPMLEKLVIDCAIISSDLEVVGPSLKRLDIHFYGSENSIKVYAPNLTLLKIDHDTDKLFLENVPKMVDMILNCRFHSTMHNFATAASQLETLTISMDRPKAPFSVPQMPKLKKLSIDDRFHIEYVDNVPFPITCFLRASPCLEELEVEITSLTLEVGVFEIRKVDPVFRHLSLKRFKILWFCGGSPSHDRIKLVRCIVDNCVALEEIDISQCDGMEMGIGFCVPVDYCIRAATTEERVAFEKTMQLELPALIKLRIVNHSHKSYLELLHGL